YVSYVPTAVSAGPYLVPPGRKVFETEFAVLSSLASSKPPLPTLLIASAGDLSVAHEDFYQRASKWLAAVFNAPLHHLQCRFLLQFDTHVTAPVRGLTFKKASTF